MRSATVCTLLVIGFAAGALTSPIISKAFSAPQKTEITGAENMPSILPEDEGQQVILTLDKSEDGVLMLHAEKHPRLPFGIVQRPTMQCPFKGPCNDRTLVPISVD